MVKKLRVSLALQPVGTALFANSPFTEGKPNGFLSFARSEIWRDTDNARAGMLPWAFEDGMGYERYVDYALDVPMYFIERGDSYIDVAGSAWGDLFAGKHPAVPGERATLSDWANHVSTIFPEVRLKRFLEMRGFNMSGRGSGCRRFRRFGSACSMTTQPSMRLGRWSRAGVPYSVSRLRDEKFRVSGLRRRSTDVRCKTLRLTALHLRAPA